MSGILVFLQGHGSTVSKASRTAIAVATTLKAKWGKASVVGLVLGAEASKIADDACNFGFAEVLFSQGAEFEKYRALPFSQAVLEAMKSKGCDTLVLASTSSAKDFAPRVAAALEAGQASDIIGVNDDGSLRRPVFAGNFFADVEITTAVKVVTVRASAFTPATPGASSGKKTEFKPTLDLSQAGEVTGYQMSSSARPELGDAEIVVSGGRALQSAENFEKYIFPLADAFGAAVGASRAAVDSGYAPNDWQVGQTGKIVAPNLYVAVGISGAIQHLAGMKDSKVIVAINKDGDAPIYEIADYGLVADLYQAVPELTEAVKKAKAG